LDILNGLVGTVAFLIEITHIFQVMFEYNAFNTEKWVPIKNLEKEN